MKQADIKTDGTKYRRRDYPYPVEVVQTGVARWGDRKDHVVVKALGGPLAGKEARHFSKDILHEWGDADEANLTRTDRANAATNRARVAMARAGFENPTVRVTVQEVNGQVVEIPRISLYGDDAAKLLAMVAVDD